MVGRSRRGVRRRSSSDVVWNLYSRILLASETRGIDLSYGSEKSPAGSFVLSRRTRLWDKISIPIPSFHEHHAVANDFLYSRWSIYSSLGKAISVQYYSAGGRSIRGVHSQSGHQQADADVH